MSEENQPHNVIIKGTKEGLIFYLDDECSFQELMDAVNDTLSAADDYKYDSEEKASVTLKLGHRYLQPEQKERLKQVIQQDERFVIEKYDAEVIGKQEAEMWLEKSEIKRVTQIVRSGQVVKVTGDLLLIGDVNPGGQVQATGNIYVLGNLHGIAHAGTDGYKEAVIAASYMHPTQLRIAKYISRAPDFEAAGIYMECGYLNTENNQIVIDRLQVLPYIHKPMRNTERGMMNG